MIYVLDNWLSNNSSGGRGGRDSDNWVSHSGGRDTDKWGARGGSRDSDGWVGRGNKISPWRGGSGNNRRRNDDWEGSNQKRWRRDDNLEWDEQQNPWKRGATNDEEEWHNNNKQGSQWAAGKKDEGNYSKFKNRDSNEERHRRPSKWGNKESDDNGKEDRWGSRKSVEHTTSSTSKDECNIEEGSHQTSAPMDLDSFEGESVDNIEQHSHETEAHEMTNSNKELSDHDKVGNDYQEKVPVHHNSGNYVAETYDQSQEPNQQNVDEQHNDKCHQFDEYQNDSQGDIKEVQQNSDNQSTDELVQQNVEEKRHDAFNAHSSRINLNSQPEYETGQNDEELVEQDQQLSRPVYKDNDITSYEHETPDYDHQSYGDQLSHESNSHEQQQQQRSANNFDGQADKIVEERYADEEKVQETQSNFYFGTDCESSINKCVELAQRNDEVFPTERTEMAPPDHDEPAEITAAESNQS